MLVHYQKKEKKKKIKIKIKIKKMNDFLHILVYFPLLILLSAKAIVKILAMWFLASNWIRKTKIPEHFVKYNLIQLRR